MDKGPEPKDTLESRTVLAHRDYVEALAALERTVHLATCPTCRCPDVTVDEFQRRIDSAESDKERKRVVFRDLCDELGFVPEGNGIAVPSVRCPLIEGTDQ